MGKRFFVLMMVLVLLFASEEMTMKVAEAKMCRETNPSRFGCVNDHTCLKSCERRGYTDGNCKGLTRRCVCYKPCA